MFMFSAYSHKRRFVRVVTSTLLQVTVNGHPSDRQMDFTYHPGNVALPFLLFKSVR